VLVDALSALNAGPAAVSDLRHALSDVMSCFRLGANSIVSQLFGRRVERVLFAATKADMLNHADHDKLENILRVLVREAASRADDTGTIHDVAAMAAIRATREASVTSKGEELQCIAGLAICQMIRRPHWMARLKGKSVSPASGHHCASMTHSHTFASTAPSSS
jgi:predicted YcjX-like family ATPase